MAKSLLPLLLWSVSSAIVIEGHLVLRTGKFKGPSEKAGFRLLGTSHSTSSISEDWNYWESINSAGWAEAKRDCEANYDTLLCMEDNEEVNRVGQWLEETDSSGSLYWVGAKYDVGSEKFIWDNGIQLDPDAPWDVDQPRHAKPNTRVAASTAGRVITLKTQASTVVLRYICEERRVAVGDDLVIVVDSSRNIPEEYYALEKEFTARLATVWIDHPKSSHVSVLLYSSNATTIISLADDQNLSSIKDKVYTMPYFGGDTNVHLGIELASEEFQANHMSNLQNMIVVVNGPSSSASLTKASADRAISLGIRTFSLGVGAGADEEELLHITGGNSERVFSSDRFEELLEALRRK